MLVVRSLIDPTTSEPVVVEEAAASSGGGPREPPRGLSRVFAKAALIAAVCSGVWSSGFPLAAGGEESEGENALAVYADAANFQTNGAIELAIDQWKRFLARFPDHEMASKAAHYLGVCFMQREMPDYESAANAFGKALEDSDYQLREESLANRGWCLYAAGGGERPEEDLLRQSISTYETLRREFPSSRFLDRSWFYTAEAAYALGEFERAVRFYDRMLDIPAAEASPLRCDALYGRGVAQEDLEKYDQAIASYRKLLKRCEDAELITEVQLRLGDLMIVLERFDEAVEALAAGYESSDSPEDRAYALFRQGYALVQRELPGEAAKRYEQLLAAYPESRYAAAATLASAQSTYRSGDMKLAAQRFEKVLALNDPAAATEAAHWLSRIHLREGKIAEARETAAAQLEAGAAGEFAMELRLDLAESLSLDPKTLDESIDRFERAFRESPDDPLAPRALYNAAFSALQAARYEKATELAEEFLDRFPEEPLTGDARFVAAESRLLSGQVAAAADAYGTLLKRRDASGSQTDDSSQRPIWVLRAATAFNAAGRFEKTVNLVREEAQSLPDPSRRAEAQILLGQALLGSDRPAEAADAFRRGHEASPEGPRASEARLRAGQAELAAGNRDAAVEAWKQLIADDPDTRMAAQAEYKVAQLASREGDHGRAVESFERVIASDRDPALHPFALYGKGWAEMQRDNHAEAIESLDRVLASTEPSHPIHNDALLARGISRRHAEQFDAAREDLEAYLQRNPRGINLGHALYELALIEQRDRSHEAAAERLQRLADRVPDYPSMGDVLYELGWSFRELGEDTAAADAFTRLVEEFPDSSLAGEAAYFLGQRRYQEKDWKAAAEKFRAAASSSDDDEVTEKALYRLGWALFKLGQFDEAREAFRKQVEAHPSGRLFLDALMMVGQIDFRDGRYETALESLGEARGVIAQRDETAENLRDGEERQVRELVLLRGGQSAAQLERWDTAIGWYDELRERFPATRYLPQVFYELGFAYQQNGDRDRAFQLYAEVADKYRNEVAARARFMMGEIRFAQERYEAAIPEFQRVMFGFGAEEAPEAIKNWQVKSAFEAGRCAEALMRDASKESSRTRSREIASKFYRYVVEKHPQHELAPKSRERLEELKQPS